MTNEALEWSYSRLAEIVDRFTAPDEDPARQRKRQRIVDAAKELISRHGYRKVSVDEIASRAHVAKGTIYLYYKNKADILVQAIAEEEKPYLVRMKPILDGTLAPREGIKEYIRLSMTLATELPIFSKLLQGDHEVLLVLEEMDAKLRDEILEQNLGLCRHLIRAAATPGSLSAADEIDRARILSSLTYSGSIFFRDPVWRGVPIERFAELLADAAVDGLLHPAPIEPTTETRESAR